MDNHISLIKNSGFTNVKWYDQDLEYTYYDASLNNVKVEVRINSEDLEWRYLGLKIEDIEWYSLKVIEEEVPENKDTHIKTYNIKHIETEKIEDMNINIFVEIEEETERKQLVAIL